MLKLRDNQMTMWDTTLPEAIRKLSAELAVIAELLDDARFLQPSVELHVNAALVNIWRKKPS